MKEPARRGDFFRGAQILPATGAGSAPPGENRVRQRAERLGRHRMIPRQPRRAPEVRDPSPRLQRGSASVHRGKRPFLLANLLHGVVGHRFEREAHGRTSRTTSRTRRSSNSERSIVRSTLVAGRRSRRTTKHGEPGAEQAVAHLQPVIEKAERPIAGKGRQPQRQPGKLHGHGIQVDAVQTAFGHGSADRGALVLADVARVAAAGPDERRFVRGAR